MRTCDWMVRAAMAVTVVPFVGCGENATLLNPSFVNFVSGGVVPLTPGPASSFVLVRVNNRTADAIEFLVTVEREVETVTGDGDGTQPEDVSVVLESETFRLFTFPAALANDVGILLECPITRVGLGEDLDRPTEDPGLFIGTTQGGVIQGFGVPGNVNPLDARVGNFTCGDTLVFEAAPTTGTVGNVQVKTFLLRAADQPVEVSGPDTFNNARALLESQRPEDEE